MNPAEQAAWRQFGTDLAWAVRVSTGTGLMTITVGLIGSMEILEGLSRGRTDLSGLGLLASLVELFYIGFLGTQRVWFLCLARGRELPGSVWTVSWAFFWRFVRLGLVVAIPTLVLSAILTPLSGVAGLVIGLVVTGLIADVVLTFVVPELVFVTDSAVQALRGGLHLLGRTWPHSALYALTPGLTLLALGQALGGARRALVAGLVAGLFGGVAGVYFKGAIVAYYLRLRPEIGSMAVRRRGR